jgi:hypothetical protein
MPVVSGQQSAADMETLYVVSYGNLIGAAEQCSALREAAQPVLGQGDQAGSNRIKLDQTNNF